MNIKSFLKLVEIQTKAASVTPFALGTLIAIYRFGEFNFMNFLLMFISLLCIDMATTAINNYMDYKKAVRKYGYGYEVHNAIVKDNLKESNVITVILGLLITAVIFGFILYLNTNIIVLILGATSFVIGVCYSFGPIPISRTPFGEILSGFFMGGIILFLSIYIHLSSSGIIGVSLNEGILSLNLNIKEVLYILLLAIPAIAGIANIMLANNICDREDDIENKRYTLPVYVGNDNALEVFKWTYYIAYVDLVILIILGIEPLLSILALATFIIVNRNIKVFEKEHVKSKTFILSVKNFIIINGARVISYALTLVITKFIL
ncbi:1,4-dihydroxy-2-naphthoate polyprenyltransferase [Clostridium intestinale]|uniref:1,4-dihydroxy-2-naphthoate octaprenyltransferase n=1 Tax=Clostridium intestinale DSM 6191 TaxID=1121320 RepID=A0A1M5ZBY8_9CLOT|nr:1,4-dihydroxy-2-naphthoate polyprenyltransferase [Clostridium intestinale]SHI21710.1 1,4-dihydroxy-2-naphthoate octaprenyltransferase [Clostridium intestinale DSM 6191]